MLIICLTSYIRHLSYCSRRSILAPRLLKKTWRGFLWILVVLVTLFHSAWASDVLFITKSGADVAFQNQVRRASKFYGLDVQTIAIGAQSENVLDALRRSHPLAAIVSVDVLDSLERVATINALRRPDGSRIPLLILATKPQGASQLLPGWTGRRVDACREVETRSSVWKMMFSRDLNVVHQLAGVSADAASAPVCELVLSRDPAIQVLADMDGETNRVTTFIYLLIGAQPIFVATAIRPVSKVELSGGASLQEAFTSIAELMIFLRQAAGERAWHMPASYANLTVDDPWLTEPYGGLGYKALLREMEIHNFHTTIAFVPWNFDRSQPEVVSLFQDHSDRFSISIHGNNHNHREFGGYNTQPFEGQRKDIKQALARMEQFRKRTGLPYDRVMVFPHAVAPAETFGILKKDDYWATVNSQNVPLGSRIPEDPLFPLTPWTLAFKGFPSVKRISAEVPVSNIDVAVNSFLGNPELFYVHQEFFEDQIGAFNAIADQVNRLEPQVRWKSLGYIMRHLYLIRLRSDQDYDVLAISSNLALVNPTERSIVFHVHKSEDPEIPLRTVLVDGIPVAHKSAFNEISFDVLIGPKQSRDVKVSYSDGVSLASVDISKKSLLITFDRRLSDFRDLRLSRSVLGRKVQSFYYRYGLDSLERLAERSIGFLLAIIAGYLLFRVIRARSRRDK